MAGAESGEMTTLRGKTLHPKLEDQVLARYHSGQYDDAVFSACKVLELALREALGLSGSVDDAVEVVTNAFRPSTGALQDPARSMPEREGLLHLFRGTFMYYRNPLGHRFSNHDFEEAHDIIVMVNRLLLIVDAAIERNRNLDQPDIHWAPQTLDVARTFRLDTDNDEQEEVISVPSIQDSIQRQERVRIFDVGDSGKTRIHTLERLDWSVEDVVLIDIDHDGKHEVMWARGWGESATALELYRYQDNEYLRLLREDGESVFVDARVVDFDHDGKLEIVTEPFGTVPTDLLPDNYVEGERDIGRIRQVWKWNAQKRAFEAILREFLYIGGR